MRVLITLSPLMYREAVTQSVRQHRPGFEVRIASPEAVEEEVMSFEPHLLVRNDTDGADMDRLTGALCWVEILYSDGLNARVSLDGEVWEIEDVCMDDLISLIEQTAWLIPEDTRA